MNEDFEQVTKVITMENFVLGDFNAKWDLAAKNSRFFAVKHWTEGEADKISKQGRIPYRFDKTSHIIQLLLGAQRQGRSDISFLERKEEDGARVNVANAVWKYFADLYKFPFVESDVFQDGLVSQCGAFEVDIDKSQYYAGNLRVRRVPFDMLLWDTNTRSYDLNEDCTWMSRRSFYTSNNLKAKFPDKAKLIDLTSFDSSTNPVARPLRYNLWYDPTRQLIGVRDFYERQYQTKYLIWQRGTEEPEDYCFDSPKEAKKEIRNRLAQFEQAQNALLSVGELPSNMQVAPEFDILPFDKPVIIKSTVMLNGILEEEHEFAPNRFPFSLFFAYFHDGDHWTAMERLRDPQTFFNRMLMQADYWLGTMAKGLLRIDPNMPEGRKRQAHTNWGKTGGSVEAKAGQLELIEGRGPAPQIFTMAETADQVMQDAFGGANFIGLKETASESGRAVLARQAQAGMDNFVPLDNMRRTKQQLGELIAWYLTNEISVARQLRITGDSMEIQDLVKRGVLTPHPQRPNVGYVNVNTVQDNTIENLEMDVVIGEAPYSPTMKQASLAAMTDAFKSGMVPIPPPVDVSINLLPLPDDIKQKWLAEAANQKPPVKTQLQIAFKDLPPGIQNQIESAILGLQPNPVENAVMKASEATGNIPPPKEPKKDDKG